MKKIFYFLLLMISGIVWGQPNIEPLEEGKYLFEDLKLESHVSSFDTSGSDCAFSGGETYKYFSFKANFDMVFAFDLIASQSDFRFIVWKVQKGKNPNVIFDRGTTIKADGSVQGSTNLKGMKEGVSNKCESNFSSSATGYVKAFDGTNILKEGETVVIAVYGGFDNVPFDIKVNVAEEREIPHSIFNNLCEGQAYSYQQVVDAIKSHISSNSNPVTNPDIKLYRDNTFSTLINDVSTTFNTNTTLYAQVRDTAGNLKFIYTIPISFIPEHQFNFNSIINQISECTLNYTLKENILLNLLFPIGTDLTKYKIKTVNGTAFLENSIINLTAGGVTDFKIIVSYNGTCPVDSVEKIIQVKQGTPEIKQIKEDVTCDSTYKISFDYIYSELARLGFDRTQYDLIVTLNGVNISDGQPIAISTTLNYKIKVISKIAGCESNEVDFIVTKTSHAKIKNAIISGICLTEFKEDDVNDATNFIQDNLLVSYNLRFYKQDGIEILESDLYDYIKTNKIGKIIVKALAVDNGNTICDTDVELNFALDESDIILPTTIPVFEKKCMEAASVTRFEVSEIEKYLEDNVYHQHLEFRNFDLTGYSLNENSELEITYDLRKAGECWTFSKIIIKTINKPNVNNALGELMADCDDKINIDAQVLSDLFGSNSIIDYDYQILHDNSTPLTFDASGKASIKVLFKNKLDNSCFVEKEIIINKKQDLVVDKADLENYTKDHPIIYCDGDDANAKEYIKTTILGYIEDNYFLVSIKDENQIFAQFNSNQGSVDIDFYNSDYCGTITLKLNYQKNALPDFNIPISAEICSATKYILDFEKLAKDRGLDVNDYIFDVDGIDKNQVSTYRYELGVGDYSITISNKDSGCPKEFILKLTNSETPTINKITINEKSIIVSAKGNGKLEYALFDSDGKVIVDWQTKNELIIPDKIKNNDFTVRVRLNNCGVSEEVGIIYLDLPNVVTPNNDGFNDIWKPRTSKGQTNDLAKSYKLLIFDRYGKQILSKEGIGIIEWDGTLNGKPLADGTYWYLLQGSKSGVLEVKYSGSILVKRKIN
ncbi:T9SS type B sorting domain-containing protein [Empedobacter falsenii]